MCSAIERRITLNLHELLARAIDARGRRRGRWRCSRGRRRRGLTAANSRHHVVTGNAASIPDPRSNPASIPCSLPASYGRGEPSPFSAPCRPALLPRWGRAGPPAGSANFGVSYACLAGGLGRRL